MVWGGGGHFLKIRDVCMDFEPYFKVHNLVSVHPKSVILGQMTNLNMVFHVVVSVYRLVKIWNSPQFPDEFRNGQCDKCVFRYRQSSVRRLLPASDYCRACGNQIAEHSSDNETVLGSSRKLGLAAEHLIDGSEKPICRLSFEF